MHLATSVGHLPIAKLLVEHGADVRAENKYGMQPIHLASGKNQRHIVEWLVLEMRVKLDVRNKFGRTPLHVAAASGKTDVVLILLQAGADVLLEDKVGQGVEVPVPRCRF